MATNQDAAHEQRALRRRRRVRQLLGAVVCLLVVIGAASVVSGGVRLTAKLFDDSEEKAEYQMKLRNLVALDPVPFDSLSEADMGTLLNAAIWSSIGDSSTYEHDESDRMYLPTIDIDRTAAQLYGPNFKFTYETFENHGMTFEYVEEKQAYLLPITSAINDYSPLVESIRREGDTKRVTVGYVSLYTAGGEFSLTADPKPVKYLDYIFTRQDGEYYLTAIVESAHVAESASSSSASSTAMDTPMQQLPENAADALGETPAASTSVSAADAGAAEPAAPESVAAADDAVSSSEPAVSGSEENT